METSSEMIGREEVVQIDEAKLGKRKYNKRRSIRGQWIFDGIQRSNKRLFIEPGFDRPADTLLIVILRNG